jgi:hypothetical protein
LDPDCRCDGLRHEAGIGDRRQIGEPHTVRVPFEEPSCHLKGQSGLAAPARAGQGEQAGRVQQAWDIRDLLLAPDETGELGGEVVEG